MITHVGVLGAGTMGHGIAHVSAVAGFEVTLYDVTLALAETGVGKIRKNLEIGVEKKKVTPADRDAALGRIKATGSLSDLAGCQLTIEAIPEKMELKQQVFKE